MDSIIIENDGNYTEMEYEEIEDVSSLSKEEIIDKIREAGIVGMGGAGFPTHVKLSPKEPEKIEYIIANCAECEPYLTSDYRRMVEQPEKLVEGMRIILQLFPHAKGVFGVEDNKPDCIQKLRELTAGGGSDDGGPADDEISPGRRAAADLRGYRPQHQLQDAPRRMWAVSWTMWRRLWRSTTR